MKQVCRGEKMGTKKDAWLHVILPLCISVLGCHHEVPQTGWLKTTEMDPLRVLGQQPKMKVLSGLSPSQGSERGKLFHASLPASGDGGSSLTWRCVTPVFASGITCHFPCVSSSCLLAMSLLCLFSGYKDTSYSGLGLLLMTSS